ncbi:unnamed protein product, partial [Prorocentrum cordatum]
EETEDTDDDECELDTDDDEASTTVSKSPTTAGTSSATDGAASVQLTPELSAESPAARAALQLLCRSAVRLPKQAPAAAAGTPQGQLRSQSPAAAAALRFIQRNLAHLPPGPGAAAALGRAPPSPVAAVCRGPPHAPRRARPARRRPRPGPTRRWRPSGDPPRGRGAADLAGRSPTGPPGGCPSSRRRASRGCGRVCSRV